MSDGAESVDVPRQSVFDSRSPDADNTSLYGFLICESSRKDHIYDKTYRRHVYLFQTKTDLSIQVFGNYLVEIKCK